MLKYVKISKGNFLLDLEMMTQITTVHWCARRPHCLLSSFFNATRDAMITAHIRQTSLEQDSSKCSPEVLVCNKMNSKRNHY